MSEPIFDGTAAAILKVALANMGYSDAQADARLSAFLNEAGRSSDPEPFTITDIRWMFNNFGFGSVPQDDPTLTDDRLADFVDALNDKAGRSSDPEPAPLHGHNYGGDWIECTDEHRADPALQATGEPHPFRDRSFPSISCADCGEEPVHDSHRGYRTAERAGATGEGENP